jgi:hypothetical protein
VPFLASHSCCHSSKSASSANHHDPTRSGRHHRLGAAWPVTRLTTAVNVDGTVYGRQMSGNMGCMARDVSDDNPLTPEEQLDSDEVRNDDGDEVVDPPEDGDSFFDVVE